MRRKKKSSRHCSYAFSLIELMVVVSIIGIMATLAATGMRRYIAKARQAEARTNLSYLVTTLESLDEDAANAWVLTVPDFSNTTSCHQPNDLGFYPTDCRKLRYKYRAEYSPTGPSTAVAIETRDTDGTRRVGTHCELPSESDLWFHSRAQGQVQFIDGLKCGCAQMLAFSPILANIIVGTSSYKYIGNGLLVAWIGSEMCP